MKSKPTPLRPRGFTLIEILVVIAIIALLAAILFPVFSAAREKARQSTCASNMKQIGVGITMYSQDYDETFPIGNEANTTGTGNTNWYFTLDPYVKQGFPMSSGSAVGEVLGIWVCPDWEATSNTNNNTIGIPNPYYNIGAGQALPSRSYSINWNLSGYLGTGVTEASAPGEYRLPGNISKVQDAAQTVLVNEGRGEASTCDGNDTNNFTSVNYPDAPIAQTTGTTPGVPNVPFWQWEDNGSYVWGRIRHHGGSNYLFVDGHVKWEGNPVPNVQADGVTPTINTTTIVYRKSSNPNAAGWFRED